jgi:Ca2+-binding RTX toxin-like protein
MIDSHVFQAPLQQSLARFAATESFEQTMARVFGSQVDRQQLSKLKQQWSSGAIVLPPIEVLASADINGAQGAFAVATGKIYLAQEFLENSSIAEVTAVLLEEYGHFLDAQFNTVDTAGDEGALFSLLVRGHSLSATEISNLQAEDDRALVTIDGQQIWIEQANIDGNDSDNNLDGTASADTIRGFAGRDTLSGSDGNDSLIGGLGSDLITGGTGNDTIVLERFSGSIFTNDFDVVTDFVQGQDKVNLTGLGISDFSTLLALASNDASNNAVITTRNNGASTSFGYSLQLTGINFNGLTAGDFILATAAANDNLVGGNDSDDLFGGLGNDTLQGGAGSDRLFGEQGNDRLLGGLGSDTLTGGVGNDTIVLERFGGSIFTNDLDVVTDFVQGQDKIDLTGLGISDFSTLLALSSNNASNNAIITTRNNGASTSFGYSLQLNGINFNGLTTGDFIFATTAVNDNLVGGNDSDDLFGGLGNDTLQGGAGSDRLFGEQGNDRLLGGLGSDTLTGGIGNDTIVLERFGGSIFTNDLDVVTDFVQGQDKIDLTGLGISDFSTLLALSSNNASNNAIITTRNNGASTSFGYSLQLNGINFNGLTTGDFIFATTAVNDNLVGGNDSDDLFGGLGNDTLQGGAGSDRLFGEQGNDRLLGGLGSDTLTGGLGNDTIALERFGGSIFTNDLDTVTGFVQGQDKIDLTGLGISDFSTLLALTSNDASNNAVITTRNNSASTSFGYSLQLTGINFNALTAADFIFSTNVFNESLTGGNDSDDLFGGLGNDTLQGGAGSDRLFGEQGNDRLLSGLGSDTLTGGLGNDTIVLESFNGSIFTSDLDIVTGFIQGQDKIDLTGLGISDFNTLLALTSNNASNNSVITTRNNSASTSFGYSLQLTGINFNTLTAADFIFSTNVFNETFTGGANSDDLFGGLGNDTLLGGAGDDRLFGEQGIDSLVGGTGNDSYYITNIGDVVDETSTLVNEIDHVYATVSYQLGNNVENLTLMGTAAINATGNAGNNLITGNSAANTLDGGAGIDTLVGGLGNDTYIVDTTTDIITEAPNEGTDTVQSSVTFSLASLANLENITLTGVAAINATGNASNNTLIGNSAANLLTGGLGNDTYVIDATDTIIEAANEGIDTVQSSGTFSLAPFANLENITLTGVAAINATGNASNNNLTGNTAANILNGGTGVDTLVGGLGNDTYIVDTTTDTITEAAGAGTDTVQSSVTFSLAPFANLENITLTGVAAINATGNTSSNNLTGNSAANILDGGAGIDTLVGGLGNDTYIVDTTTDTITEAASAGTDTVQSSVTFSLAPLVNLENVTLTGVAAINATGNASNNNLTGNSAANILDGSTGVDTLVGGLGNDTYIVDTATDKVILRKEVTRRCRMVGVTNR